MIRAFQWDLARQIERPDVLLKWLPRYAEWGYQQLYLCLEDAFDFPSVPEVGRKHAFSPRQMEKIVREAGRHGIQVIPIVPLWGHTTYLLKAKSLRHLNELSDESGNPLNTGILCPLHEETLELSRKLISDLRPYCSAGIIHVSLDESFDMGKCPRCRREIDAIGLGRHFANHTTRLHGICTDLGLRMGMWADMLYYIPEAIPLLPRDVIAYDWYYYPFKRFPRVELYNFAETDSLGALRKAGLQAFGCPNNGPFNSEPLPPFLDRLRNIISWWEYCKRRDATGMLVTSWFAKYSAFENSVCVDAAAADLWLEPGEREPRRMLEAGFERFFGSGGRKFAALGAGLEKYQYSGYYRWKANTQWNSASDFQPTGQWRKEASYFRRLKQRADQMEAPALLRDSLEVRHYLAERDLFIREGSRAIAQARKADGGGNGRKAGWKEGRKVLAATLELADELERTRRGAVKAAKDLWTRSRYADDSSPLQELLENDARLIRETAVFLERAMKGDGMVFGSSPLMGRWHLLFQVRNFAPALQGVIVQVRQPDGRWENIHRLWSLEFTVEAGQRNTDFLRRHSVPFDWNGEGPMTFRIGVGGIGVLEIFDALVTDGVTVLRPRCVQAPEGRIKAPRRIADKTRPGTLIGLRVPRSGFPRIDWKVTQGSLEVDFERSGK